MNSFVDSPGQTPHSVPVATVNPGLVWPAVYIALAVVSLVVVALLGLVHNSRLVYDEPWYMDTVRLWQERGMTLGFLRALPGPPGPLYTWVHAALRPLTECQPGGSRLANVLMGLVALAVLARCLKDKRTPNRWVRIAAYCAVPQVYLITGLALTEMPVILLLAPVVWLFIRVCDEARPPRVRWICGVAAGLLVSMAASGRQTVLPLLPAAVLAFARFEGGRLRVNRALLGPGIAFCVVGALVPAFLFLVWGGLTPPLTTHVSHGLSIRNLLYSLGYLAVVMAILNPRFYVLRVRTALGALAAAALYCALAYGGLRTPGSQVVMRILSPALVPGYVFAANVALIALGLYMVALWTDELASGRADPLAAFLILSMVGICFTSLKITHTYGSRYTALCVPLAVAYLHRYPFRVGPAHVAILMAGASLGLFFLRNVLK